MVEDDVMVCGDVEFLSDLIMRHFGFGFLFKCCGHGIGRICRQVMNQKISYLHASNFTD